ncbi:MAG: hypothetical protein PHO40_07105 [Candidatus Omnitrophica bacterium]|jgi:hypothetical protein|nr:hypothetical protein [Candidatus Omnitrophota bacterium]
MKKALFVILVLCFVSSLALAQEAAKPADDKAMMETGAASGVVVVSDEAKTDAAVATDETKMTEEEKAAADKAAADKVACETVKK